MLSMEGKYKHYKNENIDEYFAAVGVPYIARKMMAMSSPTMEFKKEGDEWIMTTISMIRTIEQRFKLNEEYDEQMPGTILKSIATIEGDELVINSTVPDTGDKTTRRYLFTDDELIVTLTHDKSKNPTKRFFKKIKEEK